VLAPRPQRGGKVRAAKTDRQRAALRSGRGVTVVRWPSEAERRSRLADQQVPRLLLVDGGFLPPESLDCLEDWIRLPAPGVRPPGPDQHAPGPGRATFAPSPRIGRPRCRPLRVRLDPLSPVEAHLADASSSASRPSSGGTRCASRVAGDDAAPQRAPTCTCSGSADASPPLGWPFARSARGAHPGSRRPARRPRGRDGSSGIPPSNDERRSRRRARVTDAHGILRLGSR